MFLTNIIKMKKTLRPMLLLLSVMAISSMILLSCDSYERRMAKFKKTATEYKKTLGPNNQIIAERIDSIVQKVYYAIDDDGDGACENIKIHNYATGKTKLILPESGKIEDYKFCGVAYSKSKLISDRLFLEVVSNCMCEICDHGIFYVDVRNDSLHYVEQCTSADFDGSNKLNIHKTYYVGEDKYGSPINKSKDYTLSTSLSDEAYTDNRREQKKIEERLAEEWREQEKTRRRDEVKTWLVGTWESKGWDEWIGRYTSYVCITENNLRFGYNGQDIYNGPYEIDMESHSIIFDRHDGYYTHIGFNPQKKRLEGEDGVFRKVSNSACPSSSNSYGSRGDNSVAKQLEKLDEEESRLIEEGNKAVRSGRANVALLKVFKMKDINSERIRLARQSGDSDLVRYYESRKIRSESIIRQWGFN